MSNAKERQKVISGADTIFCNRMMLGPQNGKTLHKNALGATHKEIANVNGIKL